mmetsp:Transcript_8742/g.9609  ORF Transcript_8742/g.9609 Transcript_8742/m.9609 type:complete len:155 (+) Transcript_8742:160-624(+)
MTRQVKSNAIAFVIAIIIAFTCQSESASVSSMHNINDQINRKDNRHLRQKKTQEEYQNSQEHSHPYHAYSRSASSSTSEPQRTSENKFLVDQTIEEIYLRRELLRQNVTLGQLVDETALSSYDASEWSLLFLLMFVSPLLIGLTIALFFSNVFY